MALLIDDRTRYIRPAASGDTSPSSRSPDFSQAVDLAAQRAREATERARDAALARREAAGGPGQLTEGERVRIVEPGDTMTYIAAQSGLPLDELIEANTGNVADPDLIYPGEAVFLPPPELSPTAESEEQRARDAALAERAAAGGSGELAEGERVTFIAPGDRMTDVAAEYDLPLDKLIDANIGNVADPDLIHPGEALFLPPPDPALAAAGPRTPEGAPEGEAAFSQGLNERGNALEHADAFEDLGFDIPDLQAEVLTYLQNLPAGERQAAAQRLLDETWETAGPARMAIQGAASEAAGPRLPNGVPEREAALSESLNERGNALEHADAFEDLGFDIPDLQAEVLTYLQNLPAGERQAAAQRLLDETWETAGPARMAIQGAAAAEGLTLEPTTNAGAVVDQQARDIIAAAVREDDPVEALRVLNEGYAAAPAPVKAALRENPGLDDVFGDAAEWAIAGLDLNLDEAAGEAVPFRQMAERLEEATRDLAPVIATAFFREALPAIERAYREAENSRDGPWMIGPEGTRLMSITLGRIAGTPEGDEAIARFAETGIVYTQNATVTIGSGESPAYAIALAAHDGSDILLDTDVYPGIDMFQIEIDRSYEAYSEHIREIGWMSENLSAFHTPEELQAAIDAFEAANPGWETERQALLDDLADKGEALLVQLAELEDLSPELSSRQVEAREKVEAILGDTEAAAAISAAGQRDPELLHTPENSRILGLYARGTDRGRKLAEEAATQWIRRNTLPRIANLDASILETITDARNAIRDFGNGQIASLLGATEADLQKVTDTLEAALPEEGETLAETEAKAPGRMRQLNRDLNRLNGSDLTWRNISSDIFRSNADRDGIKAFDKSTGTGQILRTIGVAATGAGLINSLTNPATDSDLINTLKVISDAAGLSQRAIELADGRRWLGNSDGVLSRHFSSSGTSAVKVLGLLSAGFDFYNAHNAAQNGDPVAASLYAATGAGVITAALGTSTIAGPIGLGIMGTAIVGQVLWTNHRAAREFQTPASAAFLEAAGFTPEVAEALIDQSGDGFSPVPMLARYAELSGYDLSEPSDRDQFLQWINGMPAEQLALLRDNLHHTLDEIDGRVTRFDLTHEDDASYLDASLNEFSNPRVRTERQRIEQGDSAPMSLAQLEAAMDALGIGALPSA